VGQFAALAGGLTHFRAHFADITFLGGKYLAEFYWPGYSQIKVTKDDLLVMTFERKFIVSEWFDYLILNRLMIEKAQYDVVVHSPSHTTLQDRIRNRRLRFL